MKCDVVYDYTDIHKGEHWYRCNSCGAKDWFRGASDKYFANCVNTLAASLSTEEAMRIREAYVRGYRAGIAAVRTVTDKKIWVSDVSIEQALSE